MYKETIKYVDFNGVSREEDFYFHLTQAEMLKYASSESGGLEAVLDKMIQTEDAHRILELFENLVRMAYGVRSDDGRYFTKSKELSDQFISSEAYSTLFMRFLSDSDYAINFVKGITSSIQETNEKSLADLVKNTSALAC